MCVRRRERDRVIIEKCHSYSNPESILLLSGPRVELFPLLHRWPCGSVFEIVNRCRRSFSSPCVEPARSECSGGSHNSKSRFNLCVCSFRVPLGATNWIRLLLGMSLKGYGNSLFSLAPHSLFRLDRSRPFRIFPRVESFESLQRKVTLTRF